MNVLAHKVAIVTGASSGIGRATALSFAREGASVLVGARRRDELEHLVAEIAAFGGRALALAGDVQDESYNRALVELAERELGGLDIAFDNAGMIGAMMPTHELPIAQWDAVIRTNLTSAFLAAKYQVPAMLARGGGSIVFTSTFVGHTAAMANMAAYAASKAGIIGLVQVLATELAPRGIRVNALLPGGVDTAMAREFASTPEAKAYVANLHAMKRVATPEEIAKSVLYLASDASSFTTGTAMLVDGGISIHRA